jgi:hypothetical protein
MPLRRNPAEGTAGVVLGAAAAGQAAAWQPGSFWKCQRKGLPGPAPLDAMLGLNTPS